MDQITLKVLDSYKLFVCFINKSNSSTRHCNEAIVTFYLLKEQNMQHNFAKILCQFTASFLPYCHSIILPRESSALVVHWQWNIYLLIQCCSVRVFKHRPSKSSLSCCATGCSIHTSKKKVSKEEKMSIRVTKNNENNQGYENHDYWKKY